jgi:hypothetical protein
MLSRVFQGVRLYLAGVRLDSIPTYLDAIGWQGDRSEVRDLLPWLSPFFEKVELALDVGEAILPRVGMECHVFGSSLPAAKAKWSAFLDVLVARGLCLPSKRDALLAWMGHAHARTLDGPWPADLRRRALAFGPDVSSVLTRTINHIKVVYQPGRPLEAKAYFNLLETWLRYDKVKQGYVLGGVPAGEPHSSVDSSF